MDSQVFDILHTILPKELVLIIEEFLIDAYRRENAKKCSELWKSSVKSSDDSVISKHELTINDDATYMFENCICGEVQSSLVDKISTISFSHAQCSNYIWEEEPYMVFCVNKRLFTIDYRYHVDISYSLAKRLELLSQTINILFAPCVFRSYFPKWLALPDKYIELHCYNPILNLSFAYDTIWDYTSKKCKENGIRLIKIPRMIKKFRSLLKIIENFIDDDQIDILYQNYDEKIRKCWNLWH